MVGPGCLSGEAGRSFVLMYENTYDDRRGITGLAEGFLEAQRAGGFIEPPSATHGLRLEDAYRVGGEIARTRLRDGWQPAGWKVGLTNREIWPRWGLDRPIIAPVYRETIFHVPAQRRGTARADGPPTGHAGPHAHPAPGDPRLSVPMGTRAAARLEVEVVFGFADVLDAETAAGPPADPIWIALGVELVDCHYSGWRFDPADGVADFGLHAGLIVGPPVPLPPHGGEAPDPARSSPDFADSLPDPARSLPQMAVTLSADGEALARGRGDAVLGSPFNVLAELQGSLRPAAAAYPDRRTDSREAGRNYIVSTGTLTPLVEARIGTTYEVEADLLPSFSFVLV